MKLKFLSVHVFKTALSIILFTLTLHAWGCTVVSNTEQDGIHLNKQITLQGGAEGKLETFGPYEISGARNVSIEIEISSPPESWNKLLVYDTDQVLIQTIENPDKTNPLKKFWTKCGSGSKISLKVDIPANSNFTGEIVRIISSTPSGKADAVADGKPLFLNSAEIEGFPAYTTKFKAVAQLTTDPNPDSLLHNVPERVLPCTGTLLAPDLLLTAGHCLLFKESLCKHTYAVFDLDFVAGENPKAYSCKEVVYLGHNLDFALLRLSSKVTDISFPVLSNKPPKKGNKIAIVQHPLGVYRRIANDAECNVSQVGIEISRQSQSADAEQVKVAGIEHFCDTLSGSSGAPLFNDAGEIIAIQQSGRSKEDADLYGMKPMNIAVRSDFILSCLNIDTVSGEVKKKNKEPICQ